MWYDDFLRQFNDTFIVDDRYELFITGINNTLVITIAAAIIGCVIGVLIAVAKVHYAQTGKKRWLNIICNVYLAVIRGTPIVVQLMIMYYIVFVNLKNAVLVATIAFGINSGAYVAEIVRAGIMSIDIGQREAGRSLGLPSASTMRYIVIPQAIKNILPALVNEFITLLKETSVAGYVTILDFTRAGNIVRSETAQPFFSLLFVALVYFLLVMVITFVLRRVERRLRRSDRS